MVAPYSKYEAPTEIKRKPTPIISDTRSGPIVINSQLHDMLVTIFSGVVLIVCLEMFVKIGKLIKTV